MSPCPYPLSTLRALRVIEAAGRELNDELTILRNSADAEDSDITASLQRCVWIVASLLGYAIAKGVKPSAVTLARALELGEER